jgi:S1-C subfamily serine protease
MSAVGTLVAAAWLAMPAGVLAQADSGLVRMVLQNQPAPAEAVQAERREVEAARKALDGDDFLRRLNESVRRVAQAVEPSVVHVSVGASRRRGGGMVRMGQGSGWVFDEKGHVITNAHVVEDAPRIVVQLQDGRQLRATLVGADQTTDIAVVRLEELEAAGGVIAARRATGEELRQGDRVYAFGSPFGFKFSMSEGIVSGLARDPGASDGYTNYIQSDAAVNPGNSGGPLVDVRGRVVGMNVAIATGSNPEGGAFGQSAGISFAIPLATIEPVVEQLIATGKVVKGFLGISMPPSEEENAAQLEASGFRGTGVVISAVVANGPAAGVGLVPGDVIVALNTLGVANIAQLRTLIAFTPPGRMVNLRVWREGGLRDLSVELADLDRSRAELAAEQLTRFGLVAFADGDNGVTVRGVRRGSAAERAGFVPGALVLSVNGVDLRGTGLVAALAESGFPPQAAECLVQLPGGEEKQLVIRVDP